jgi:DNA (cytosine-5)-methyltransferase 1
MKFSTIDLFAGIGGFHLAVKRNGGKVTAFSEINTDAIGTYIFNHPDMQSSKNLGDITQIEKLPKCDLITAGVPCQSWSVAGKNLGFGDDRGQPWNDTICLLKESQPKAFIFENVKGVADPRHKDALDYIMARIKEAGYTAAYYVLNSAHYGVLQNRIRTYIIGFRDPKYAKAFKLPCKEKLNLTLKDILDDEVTSAPSVKKTNIFGIDPTEGESNSDNGFNDFFLFTDLREGHTTIHSWDIMQLDLRLEWICRCILRNRRKKKYGDLDGNPLTAEQIRSFNAEATDERLQTLTSLKILKQLEDGRYEFQNSKISTGLFGVHRVFLPNSKAFPTLTASDSNDFVTPISITASNEDDYKRDFMQYVYATKQYRKISMTEALRIQGFPDTFTLPDTRSVWMRLIGNSVAVPLIEKLVQSIIKTGIF